MQTSGKSKLTNNFSSFSSTLITQSLHRLFSMFPFSVFFLFDWLNANKCPASLLLSNISLLFLMRALFLLRDVCGQPTYLFSLSLSLSRAFVYWCFSLREIMKGCLTECFKSKEMREKRANENHEQLLLFLFFSRLFVSSEKSSD